MKICNQCNSHLEDDAKFCTVCGSADLTVQQAIIQQFDQAQTDAPFYESAYQVENAQSDVNINENGNILAGVVGAFLFSIIGGLLYFVIYQAGFIAGICGLVIFVLANFGYSLLAKTKNKASLPGLIASIAAMIVTIYVAEYVCISFEIFQAFKEFGITIFDAIKATPDFLKEAQIRDGFVEDIAFAYIFGFLATIGNIVNIVKARKNKKCEN